MLPIQMKKKRELETRMNTLKNQLNQLNSGSLNVDEGESTSQTHTAAMEHFYPALEGLDNVESGGGSETSSISSTSTQSNRLNIFEKKLQELSKKFGDFISRSNRAVTPEIPSPPAEPNRQQPVESSQSSCPQTTTNTISPITNLQENTSLNHSQQTTTSPLTQSQPTNTAQMSSERQTQNGVINTQHTNTNTQSSDTHQSQITQQPQNHPSIPNTQTMPQDQHIPYSSNSQNTPSIPLNHHPQIKQYPRHTSPPEPVQPPQNMFSHPSMSPPPPIQYQLPYNNSHHHQNFYVPAPQNTSTITPIQNVTQTSSLHRETNSSQTNWPSPSPSSRDPTPQPSQVSSGKSVPHKSCETICNPTTMNSISQQATTALMSILPFSGESKDRPFSDFKREIIDILNLYLYKGSETSQIEHSALKAMCLKTRLSGSALRYSSNLSEEVITNFEAMMSALQSRFSPPPNISMIRSQLATLEQGDSKVADLEERIEALARKYAMADPQLEQYTVEQKSAVLDNIKRQALHVSLKAEIFEELTKMNKMSSFSEMINFAKICESNYDIIKARKENSKTRVARIMAATAVETNVPPPAPHPPRPSHPNNQQPINRNFQPQRWNGPSRGWRPRPPPLPLPPPPPPYRYYPPPPFFNNGPPRATRGRGVSNWGPRHPM